MAKKQNILTEAKGQIITLADGKEYQLPPLNLNTLGKIEEGLDCSINDIQERFNNRMASTLRAFLHVLLKENYPKITVEEVGQLVTMDKLPGIVESIAETISGLR